MKVSCLPIKTLMTYESINKYEMNEIIYNYYRTKENLTSVTLSFSPTLPLSGIRK